jgi:hypothetical protein
MELDRTNKAAQAALAKPKVDKATSKAVKEQEKYKCDPETRQYKQPKVIHETHIWIPATCEVVHCHEPRM